MLIHIVAHGAAGISGKKIIFSEFIDFEVCSVRVGIHECCFHDTEPRKNSLRPLALSRFCSDNAIMT